MRNWIELFENASSPVAASPENIAKAKAFVFNFVAEWMGDDDSKPLYCNTQMVQEALDFINQHVERYGVN